MEYETKKACWKKNVLSVIRTFLERKRVKEEMQEKVGEQNSM